MPKVKSNTDLDVVGGGRQRRSRAVAARSRWHCGGRRGSSRQDHAAAATAVHVQICHQAKQTAHRWWDGTEWEEDAVKCEQTITICHVMAKVGELGGKEGCENCCSKMMTYLIIMIEMTDVSLQHN